MKKTFKLDKPFGPVGTTGGIVLFLAGVISSFISYSGIILLLIGAFMGFTSTGTKIDYETKQIKSFSNFFGILKIGKWIPIVPGMKIGIKRNNWVWRGYSRSNRTLDISTKDFRIILYDSFGKELLSVLKSGSRDAALTEMEKLAEQFSLEKI